jgi:hypothetical protein
MKLRNLVFLGLALLLVAVLAGCAKKPEVVLVDTPPPEGAELLPQEETDAIFEENKEIAGQSTSPIVAASKENCKRSCWPCGTPQAPKTCCDVKCGTTQT